MGAVDWMLLGWRKYADFSGRARRKEYWMFALGLLGPYFLLFILSSFASIFGYVLMLFGLAALVPAIAVGVRRMHDVDKPGWFIIIPIYNLILACTEGTKGPNQFGPDPKAGEA